MRRFLATAAAAALCSFPAFAQPAQPPAAPPGPPPHADRHHGGLACAVRDGKAAEFLARARADLKVTGAQAAAWDTFAARVGDAVRPLGERCEPAAGPRGQGRVPLPERLARMEQGQRAMLEATSGVRAAVEGLWPHLSEDQQRTAGRLMSPRHHGREGGPGPGHPPGPPPGHGPASPPPAAPAR